MINYINFFFIFSICCQSFSIEKNKPIFFTSIPKSGSHLSLKCLSRIANKEIITISNAIKDVKKAYNKICIDHFIYNESISNFIKDKFVCFCTLRDPRDILVSLAYWILKDPQSFTQIVNEVKFLNLENLLMKLIIGHFDLLNYLGWINNPNFYIIKFENLIGPRGGGTKEKQISEIIKIAKHIGLMIDKNEAKTIAAHLFGGTVTFREGKIGGWKNIFTKRHKLKFKELYGKLLIDLGYEKDNNW